MMKRYNIRDWAAVEHEKPERFRILQNSKVRILKKGAVVHVEAAIRHAPEDRKTRRA